MKYRRKVIKTTLLIVIVFFVAYAFESYFEIIELENKIIRLHILANSDTIHDQELKLKVRNNILNCFNKKFANFTNKNDSEKLIQKNLGEIKSIAQKTVYDEGYYYNVEVYYGSYRFPEKEYENITLPEGEYDAVRVEIGEAKGKNWWCVMFPPLCFTGLGKSGEIEAFDIDTEKKLKEVLTEKELELIKTNRGYSDIRLKSKIAEIIDSIVKGFKKHQFPAF